jgi:hypothetical protein
MIRTAANELLYIAGLLGFLDLLIEEKLGGR